LLVDTLEDESDGDYSRGDLSLREAIELANANNYEGVVDTIRFDPVLTAGGPATILLTHGELAITDSLTINGPGADLLTIDAQQQSRILNVTATHGDFALACLTLTHGKTTGDGQAYGGGAIRSLSDGLLSVNESVVTGNCTTGDHSPGGGIYAVGGRLSLSHSKVEDNTTLGFYSMGGGIAHATGSLTVDSTTICGNQTFGELSFGGGVYGGNDRFGDVTFDDSVIAGNSTHGKRAFGGGLDVYRGTVLLNRTTVTGNSSASDGGGIFGTYGRAYSQSLMIVDSIISGNHAARSGGGIHSPASTYLGSGSVTLIRSVISENTADGIDPPNLTSGTGGGIYVRGDLRLVQTTVSGNTAVRGDGGGIFVSRSSYSGGKIEVDRSMLSGNVAISGNGGGIATETGVKMHQSNVVGNSAKLSGGGVYGSISADNCTVAENRAGLVLQR